MCIRDSGCVAHKLHCSRCGNQSKAARHVKAYNRCLGEIESGVPTHLRVGGCLSGCEPTAEMKAVMTAGVPWINPRSMRDLSLLAFVVVIFGSCVCCYHALGGGYQEEWWERVPVTETKAEVEMRDWNQLTPAQLAGARAAGYTEEIWESDDELLLPYDEQDWWEITLKRRNGLIQLGETEATWNIDSHDHIA
eukprot:TRINITY_DN18938_c0_g2_i2.p1 TRINITY_DN18938_c0_g2~~TRINITY_DN18938_c0_g2_i2.p1  ORF type:complete len:193 (+),score=42.26 TRINITY_DN18938_c0_g2_i2:61-639(+)